MKLKEYSSNDGRLFVFFCPGCNCDHSYRVGASKHPSWEWNGSFEVPTFIPSLRVSRGNNVTECHLFLDKGMLRFLEDCRHSLAGRTVPLPDYPE